MNWKLHCLLAIVLSFGVFYYLFNITDNLSLLKLLLLAGLSALIPDIDNELSKGKKIMDSIVIVFAIIFSYYVYSLSLTALFLFLAIIGAYFILYKLFKPNHRGITHSLVLCLAFSVLIYYLFGELSAIAGFIGYGSHLVADREIKII